MSLPDRASGDMGSNGSNSSSKERLKWTKELHDSFEKAVNQIGGPDRATPKGILKAMAIPGLTIYHVKSHLQKYRMSIFTREEDHIKKFEKRSLSELLPNFSATSGAQLNEALLIQMEAQKRLTDQLEVQKSLKMKIEAQGRFLDKLMEEYKNRAPCTKSPVRPHSMIMSSLPSLSEESDESNVDSEEMEIMSRDEFQAHKRIKIHQDKDNSVLQPTFTLPSFNHNPQNINNGGNNSNNNNMYAVQEMEFPWSFCTLQSPLLPPIYHNP